MIEREIKYLSKNEKGFSIDNIKEIDFLSQNKFHFTVPGKKFNFSINKTTNNGYTITYFLNGFFVTKILDKNLISIAKEKLKKFLILNGFKEKESLEIKHFDFGTFEDDNDNLLNIKNLHINIEKYFPQIENSKNLNENDEMIKKIEYIKKILIDLLNCYDSLDLLDEDEKMNYQDNLIKENKIIKQKLQKTFNENSILMKNHLLSELINSDEELSNIIKKNQPLNSIEIVKFNESLEYIKNKFQDTIQEKKENLGFFSKIKKSFGF